MLLETQSNVYSDIELGSPNLGMVFLAQPSPIPEGTNNFPQSVGHASTNVAHKTLGFSLYTKLPQPSSSFMCSMPCNSASMFIKGNVSFFQSVFSNNGAKQLLVGVKILF